MFSINRFDPNHHSPATTDKNLTGSHPSLARLNARLEAAKRQLDSNSHHLPTSCQPSSDQPSPCSIDQVKSNQVEHEPDTTQGEQQDDHDSIVDRSKPIPRKQKLRLDLGLTGANTIPLPSLEGPKLKSKAKLKYLKRKKERRKSRKLDSNRESKKETKQELDRSDLPSTETIERRPSQRSFEQPSVEPPSNPVIRSGSSETSQEPAVAPQVPDSVEEPKRSERPKNLDGILQSISRKRRKQESLANSRITDGTSIDTPDDRNQDPLTTIPIEQISQPGVLPRFPAPINPSLPDPRLLARLAMGLGDLDDLNSNSDQVDQDFLQFDSQSHLKVSEIPTRSHPPGQFIESLSLSHHSISRLNQLGFEDLLAVQIAVFSLLMPPLSAYPDTPASTLYPLRKPPRDLCVSAPTGSGKTLSYIIPIVETLSSRAVCRLRALIVLPTRDLVLQVKNAFDCFSKGTGLKVAIITGHHSFTREQALIGNTRDGLESLVDVVIATPGRLIDHLNCTPGFSLDHLCFLVLDEADQLLSKSQTWLDQILSTIPRKTGLSVKQDERSDRIISKRAGLRSHLTRLHPESSGLLDNNSRPPYLANIRGFNRYDSRHLPIETFNPCRLRPFRILLFSATLRRDPVKLGHLGLRRPIFIKVSSTTGNDLVGKPTIDLVDELNGYCLPNSLKQHIIVTTTNLKPLVFFKLIRSERITKALCFCKSIEGATRLTRLCEFMQEEINRRSKSPRQTGEGEEADDDEGLFNAECFSSDSNPAERKKILNRFLVGRTNLLICSDIIARGIDIPRVMNVINYDSPIDIKKYIHRVGRTARAHEVGRSFTLIESQEAKFVKQYLRSGLGDSVWKDPDRVSKLRFNWNDVQDLQPFYHLGLKRLGEVFKRSIDL